MLNKLYQNATSTLKKIDGAKVFADAQNVMPKTALSELIAHLAKSERPYVKSPLIYAFSQAYGIALDEYARDKLSDYKSFNDFFTRELKTGQRPIAQGEDVISCPADGTVSQIGQIKEGQILQAKGREYSAAQLLADFEDGRSVESGAFATIYLAPSNYHRVHMPFDGQLVETRYVPGELFSVNHATASHIPDLFARNERLVCVFQTRFGKAFVVLVGAMIVAGIESVATGRLYRSNHIQRQSHALTLKKGDELGRFYLGSTAIVLLPQTASAVWKDGLCCGKKVLMGEAMGIATPDTSYA